MRKEYEGDLDFVSCFVILLWGVGGVGKEGGHLLVFAGRCFGSSMSLFSAQKVESGFPSSFSLFFQESRNSTSVRWVGGEERKRRRRRCRFSF